MEMQELALELDAQRVMASYPSVSAQPSEIKYVI